jgi:hypothetical protein
MKLKIPRVVKSWVHAPEIVPATSGFIQNGIGRQNCQVLIVPFWTEAFAAFGLTPTQVEPRFKNFTGNHYVDGVFTPVHTDPAPTGFVHVRCNVLLEKAPRGGDVIIDNEIVQTDVGDIWICLASLEEHGTTPITGGNRTIFSFGALVPESDITAILA